MTVESREVSCVGGHHGSGGEQRRDPKGHCRRDDRNTRDMHGRGSSSHLTSTPDATQTARPSAPRLVERGLDPPIKEGRSSAAILRRHAAYRRSLAVADMLAAGLALLLCVSLLSPDDSVRLVTLLALPLVVVAGKLQRLYDRDELVLNKSTLDETPRLFQLATLYTLLVFVFDAQLIAGVLGSAQTVVLWAALFGFTIVLRWLARWLVRRAITPERCLFVGSDEASDRLADKLAGDNPRAVLVGRMGLSPTTDPSEIEAARRELHSLVELLDAHRVIIEPTQESPQQVLAFVREAKATGVPVSLLPRVLDVIGSSIEVDHLDGITLLGVRQFAMSRSSKVIKRTFDLCGAGFVLICLAPLLALIAALVKRETRGPVIFRQLRVGRDGVPFEMWKFRSMVCGADEQKAQLRARNEAAAGLFKIAEDPRLTSIGALLRRYCLDEVPQLVNVLRGEMSLVGPRPLVADEDAQILGMDRRRLQLTPGMTGPWQILGSSRVPMAEMVKLDYLYVTGWSLWADVKILLRTLRYVLARRGM